MGNLPLPLVEQPHSQKKKCFISNQKLPAYGIRCGHHSSFLQEMKSFLSALCLHHGITALQRHFFSIWEAEQVELTVGQVVQLSAIAVSCHSFPQGSASLLKQRKRSFARAVHWHQVAATDLPTTTLSECLLYGLGLDFSLCS